MENKIQKMNELFADYIEDNIELIQEVTELMKRYPEYPAKLKEFNEQFPLEKEKVDDNGTLKFSTPVPELISEEPVPAVENVNYIKKLDEI